MIQYDTIEIRNKNNMIQYRQSLLKKKCYFSAALNFMFVR